MKINYLCYIQIQSKFNCYRIVKNTKILLSDLEVTFICYIMVSSRLNWPLLLIFRQIFLSFTIILTLFPFFFFIKSLISFIGLFKPFVIFFFRKILTFFMCFFSESFFVFFLIIFTGHFYYYFFFVCFKN